MRRGRSKRRAAKSGIYSITCEANGKVYIGSTVDLSARFGGHRWLLRRNKHFNKNIQNDWNQFGESAFKFAVLAYLELYELDNAEESLIQIHNAKNTHLQYNISKMADPTKSPVFDGSKTYIVTNPQGHEFTVTNLTEFAKSNNLDINGLWKSAVGESLRLP